MPSTRFAPPTEVPGLSARRIAADILDGVLHKRRTLDEQLEGAAAQADTAARPKEFQGPKGPEPTRFGDWERNGIASDF
jgi:hypothetical protein